MLNQNQKASRSSEETWLAIWQTSESKTLPKWDHLCELVYGLFKSLVNSETRNKFVLEAGSGSGRVSLRLAREGANALLIDISPIALKSSKEAFKLLQTKADFVVSDLFHLPFKDSSLDLVWSSGVLEHYTSMEQKKAFVEAFRVLQKNGSCIIIVPNADAVFYNFFRKLYMKTGLWKWGYEEPISMKGMPNLPKPISGHSNGFVHQFRFNPILEFVIGRIYRVLPFLETLDLKLPGYLVGWKWVKP